MESVPEFSEKTPEPVPPQSLNDKGTEVITPTARSAEGHSKFTKLMLLIFAVLLVAVIAGVYVWQHGKVNKLNSQIASLNNQLSKLNNEVNNRKSSPASTPTSPYAGWKTATLQYEKITYKYPPNWSLSGSSTTGFCATPGTDLYYLTSPSNDQIELHTGISCVGDSGAVDFGSAVPINALGQNLYLAFENSSGEGPPGPPNYPEFACLGTTSTPNSPNGITSKNIYLPGGSDTSSNATKDSFCYYPYNEQTDQSKQTEPPVESVSSIENQPDFKTAELIFESMSYQ